MRTLELSKEEITTIRDALGDSVDRWFDYFKEEETARDFILEDLEWYADTIKMLSRFEDLASEQSV